MNLNNLMDKMELYFDLPEKKQKKKQEKLLKIVSKLELKKARLRVKMHKESVRSNNGKVSRELCREFKVITRLLKKAKKHLESGE